MLPFSCLVLWSVVFVFFGSCTSGTTGTTTTGLRLETAADFSASASASLSQLMTKTTTTGTCSSLISPITDDDPTLADGLDCDVDGGLVAHVTPTRYAIAFKRATLIPSTGSSAEIDLISDQGTLAQSEVVVFTSDDDSETIVTLTPSQLTAGSYSGVEAELYYFQLTFPVAGVAKNVRIYMSDDDFPAEGSLGHHQGDITFIDDNGTEVGWVDSTWLTANLATTRSSAQNGAGGTDAQTGHARGFFGNTAFWNTTDLAQGAGQDIYLTMFEFSTPLQIPAISSITDLTTITVTFSAADTFYYEDYVPRGTGFFPDSGGEATSEATGWAPLPPDATVVVE